MCDKTKEEVFFMERVMSVEEKIRRAEEIYERRKQGEIRPITKVTVNDKKDFKLLKKMLLQILICVVIYLIVYSVQHNQYVFSSDFINKAKEILSYDTNFVELYEMIKSQVMGFIGQAQNSETVDEPKAETEDSEVKEEVNQEAIGGAVGVVQEEVHQNIENVENKENLTPEEIDKQNIKNTTSFIKPIEGTISSKYGYRETATGNVPKNHTGTDIAANLGTKIKSATDGEVVLASEEGDYGKHLKIQIGEVSIIYAHCHQLYVKQGEKVVQGQEIAEVGSTGNSTGPHLHFEIRISERTIDPQNILEL